MFSLFVGLTAGSSGITGRGFITDISQADNENIGSAIIGGIIFNLSNILFVAALAIAGMLIAITIGVGIALVLGVHQLSSLSLWATSYYLFISVAFIIAATIASAFAYRKINSANEKPSSKGILLAIIAGVL